MGVRNPPWVRDELILALDLYFRENPRHTSENNPEVVALSDLLKRLPIHTEGIADVNKFRNPTGVYMKMCNFLRFDPTYHGRGLDAGSRMDEVIWNEFSGDKPRLGAVAASIRSSVRAVSSPEVDRTAALAPRAIPWESEGEESYPEGRILYRLHRAHELNSTLVRKKKNQALSSEGVLRCEVCGFVYAEKYGDLGEGFIECHHRSAVSRMKPSQVTKLADLALVCANCHRMLHRGGEGLTIEALRDTLVQVRRV